MEFTELEKKLESLRVEEEVTYNMLRERGLFIETVQNIYNGREYKISSLFKYLDSYLF